MSLCTCKACGCYFANLETAACPSCYQAMVSYAETVGDAARRVAEECRSLDCSCTLRERISGHRVGCDVPRQHDALDGLRDALATNPSTILSGSSHGSATATGATEGGGAGTVLHETGHEWFGLNRQMPDVWVPVEIEFANGDIREARWTGEVWDYAEPWNRTGIVRWRHLGERSVCVLQSGQKSSPQCDCGYTDSTCAIDCPTQKGWPDDPLAEMKKRGTENQVRKSRSTGAYMDSPHYRVNRFAATVRVLREGVAETTRPAAAPIEIARINDIRLTLDDLEAVIRDTADYYRDNVLVAGEKS